MFRLFSSSLPSSSILHHKCHDQDSDTSNTISAIPNHPTQNPHVPEGRYKAVVHDVTVVTYGRRDKHDEDFIIRLIFYLPFEDLYLVSDIDLPKINRKVPFRRFQEFAAVLGLNPWWLMKHPDCAKGRHLRIHVKPIDAQVSRAGRCYSEVHAFERVPENDKQ